MIASHRFPNRRPNRSLRRFSAPGKRTGSGLGNREQTVVFKRRHSGDAAPDLFEGLKMKRSRSRRLAKPCIATPCQTLPDRKRTLREEIGSRYHSARGPAKVNEPESIAWKSGRTCTPTPLNDYPQQAGGRCQVRHCARPKIPQGRPCSTKRLPNAASIRSLRACPSKDPIGTPF